MQYNKFGKVEMPISRFGMGCMRFPQIQTEDGGSVIDEKEAIRMIRHAIDQGVNYFDTAYAYPGSEQVLGKALKDGYREKVLVATKVPPDGLKNKEDYMKIFEEEMERLQMEYIDIYIFHCLDKRVWENVKASGGLEFMKELKQQGKIKMIGFSFHADYDVFTEIIEAYSWDMCLIQLNILDQEHQAGVRGLRFAAERGIPVVIMEPLKGGLFGASVPSEVSSLLEGYTEQRSLVEWAFRWLYSQEQVKVILSGVSSMEQLEDNLRIFEQAKAGVMSDEDIKLIEKIRAIYAEKVKVGCTGCGYCMPCPNGVNIPEIFKVYNDSFLSSWTEFGKVFYSLVAKDAGKDASNCIGCRKCERHCPQKLSIVAHLKDAHALMA